MVGALRDSWVGKVVNYGIRRKHLYSSFEEGDFLNNFKMLGKSAGAGIERKA